MRNEPSRYCTSLAFLAARAADSPKAPHVAPGNASARREQGTREQGTEVRSRRCTAMPKGQRERTSARRSLSSSDSVAKANGGIVSSRAAFACKKHSSSTITCEAAARPDLRIGTRPQPCFVFHEQRTNNGTPAEGQLLEKPCDPHGDALADEADQLGVLEVHTLLEPMARAARAALREEFQAKLRFPLIERAVHAHARAERIRL